MWREYGGWPVLAICGAFFYVLNALMPLGVGDDYLYNFIWDGSDGWYMYQPLPEDAQRVTSFHDIFISQYSHYFTWGGRTVAHTLVQFFLWQGKDFFNIANTFVFMALMLEIYWLIQEGQITRQLKPFKVGWIFFALWTFVAGFASVFLWLTGSCNYLWMTTLMLAFVFPYVRLFYGHKAKLNAWQTKLGAAFILGLGILAGWGNETASAVVWAAIAISIYRRHRLGEKIPCWMVLGWLGLTAGCLLLFLAPGNYVRLNWELTLMNRTIPEKIWFECVSLSACVMIFQFLLWFFILSTLRKDFGEVPLAKPIIRFVKFLCVMALAAMMSMWAAPQIPARAVFFPTVCLIVAAGSLIRLMDLTNRNTMGIYLRRMLRTAGAVYLCITIPATVYGLWLMLLIENENIAAVQEAHRQGSQEVVMMKACKLNDKIYAWDAFHVPDNDYYPDENRWENVAFARYYGVKAVKLAE